MSKKELLSENEIRKFMKLANLEKFSKKVLKESTVTRGAAPFDPTRREDENMYEEVGMEGGEEEMDLGAIGGEEHPEPDADQMGGPSDMDADNAGEAPMGAGGGNQEKFKELVNLLASALGVKASVEDGGEGAEAGGDDMGMGDIEMSDEEGEGEGEEEAGEGEEEEEAGEEEEEEEGGEDEEEMQEGKKKKGGDEEEEEEVEEGKLSEDELVETVLRRVTNRLVQEAKKKTAAEKKKEEAKKKMAAMKKKKKKPTDEAKIAKSEAGLAGKGKNNYDAFKGVADKEWGKGENGGKGDDTMETVPAKAPHTKTGGVKSSGAKTSPVTTKGPNKAK